MKYCTHCGAEIHDEAVICIHCGCAVKPEQNVGGIQQQTQDNGTSGLLTAAKIIMIITTAAVPAIGGLFGFYFLLLGSASQVTGLVIFGIYFAILCIITLAWCVPMTKSLMRKIRTREPISTGFKVCTLIFVNVVAGILLLCHHEE